VGLWFGLRVVVCGGAGEGLPAAGRSGAGG
jgi:hypothetical protein